MPRKVSGLSRNGPQATISGGFLNVPRTLINIRCDSGPTVYSPIRQKETEILSPQLFKDPESYSGRKLNQLSQPVSGHSIVKPGVHNVLCESLRIRPCYSGVSSAFEIDLQTEIQLSNFSGYPPVF